MNMPSRVVLLYKTIDFILCRVYNAFVSLRKTNTTIKQTTKTKQDKTQPKKR